MKLESTEQERAISISELPPLPNYRNADVCNVVPAAFLHLAKSRGSLFGTSFGEVEERVHTINPGFTPDLESWFPKEASRASQLALVVLDGLGFRQLAKFSNDMPNFAAFSQIDITSVAPTTTATALTSISTGATPSTHGMLGYRMGLENDQVLNALSWSVKGSTGGRAPDPESLQPVMPFLNFHPKVVTKAQYQETGFTRAHLRGTNMFDYRLPSSMVDHVAELLRQGEAFVYAYYEGIDTVAHEYGLRACYLEELREVDYLLGRLMDSLPKGGMLLVTSDHGQVEVPDAPIELDARIMECTRMLSGEGRFRWLHLKPGTLGKVIDIARELYGRDAWVMSRDELIEGGYYGSHFKTRIEETRLGDVALISKTNVAFLDPLDTGPYDLVCRHGSLTEEELLVPLLSYLA